MTAFLSPLAGAGAQFFNNAGVVLSGGLLYTYIAGATTPQATWVDSTQNVQNPNPIVLNSAGRPPNEIWLQNGSAYKFILKDSNNNTLGTWDNIVGINVTNFSQSEWLLSGFIITYVAPNVFSVPGDQTGVFQPNRRVQYTLNSGTFYGYVSTSVFDGINTTTVTVIPDSTALDSTVTVVNYALISATNTSIPQQFIIAAADKVPTRSGATTDQFLTNNGVSSSWSALLKAGTMRFADSTDTTKRIAFNASGITTATTRTITMPDRDITLGSNTPLSSRTANTILGAADSGSIIDITANTFTQTFAAVATLGAGWFVFYRNSGTGDVTLDPNAAELIDGLTSYVMYSQEVRLIQCDGTKLTTLVTHPFYRKALSTFNFIMPPGYLQIEGDFVGGGGGGGSGARGAAATVRQGGAPGGAPARVRKVFRNLTIGGSTTVTIGAAGTGGAAQTVNSTSGITGVAGGNTTFGALLTAFGGAAGVGGASGGSIGTSGSGSAGIGSSSVSSNVLGGLPSVDQRFGGNTNSADNIDQGGGGCPANTNGGNTVWGGAGSASPQSDNATTPATLSSGSSLYGVPAGCVGGYITSGDLVNTNTIRTGVQGSWVAGGGLTNGASGAAPTVGSNGADAATDDLVGGPASGGGSTITAGQTGKAGGNGGIPGGPGGGGGAVLNGQNSGAGGNGAVGRAILWGIV